MQTSISEALEFEVKKPNGSELALTPVTPLELMSSAIQHGISAEQLQILQEMHFKSLDRQAEIEFNEALNRVQVKIPRIAPELTNPQTNSKYASFASIDRVVRPIYTSEGFSLSFNTADSPKPEHVRIIAYLSRGSHTRTYQMDMPIVTTGIKGAAMMTLTHASAAANSYGKRYLECDIFNIPVGPDTDGNGPKGGNLEDINERLEWMANASSLEELQKLFAEAYREAKKVNDNYAQQALIKAKDKRKRELQ